MNKPSWFQPLDLFPLLLPAVAAAYALISGYEAESHTQAGILLIVVPVVMWIIWGAAVWRRKKFLDSCIWYPRYKIMLQPEDWLPTEEYTLDHFIASVARSWAPYYPNADHLLKSRVKWVYMKKGLAEKPINPNWSLSKGITIAGGSVLYVDYNNKLDSIEKTALAHELGHVIMGLSTGSWDQEKHHAFAKKNHLR